MVFCKAPITIPYYLNIIRQHYGIQYYIESCVSSRSIYKCKNDLNFMLVHTQHELSNQHARKLFHYSPSHRVPPHPREGQQRKRKLRKRGDDGRSDLFGVVLRACDWRNVKRRCKNIAKENRSYDIRTLLCCMQRQHKSEHLAGWVPRVLVVLRIFMMQ